MITARLCVGAWLLMYFAAAVPVWWHLTAIKRPRLPFQSMIQAVQEHPSPQLLHLHGGSRRQGVLSFILFSADPPRDSYTWDFQKLYSSFLERHVIRLQTLTAFRVQSQLVQGGAVQTVVPRWSTRHSAYVIAAKEMPLLVDLSWGDTSVQGGDELKVLRWVMYVAPRDQQPLYLESPDGAVSDSCILPDWGGIIILNPCSASQQPDGVTEASGLGVTELTANDLQRSFAIVTAQLRHHLGLLPNSQTASQTAKAPARDPKVSEIIATDLDVTIQDSHDGALASPAEVQQLMREAQTANAAIAAQRLGSMARLLQSLPALQMPDSVGDQVVSALHSLQLASARRSSGDVSSALAASYAARERAEEAFKSPSILAQLSFPATHKLAIYLPFFLPVSMPILVTTIRELQHWRKLADRTRQLR